MNIVYLAHAFPIPEEHYFSQEIKRIRLINDIKVIICAAFKSKFISMMPDLKIFVDETEYLYRPQLCVLMRTFLVCIRDFKKLKDIYYRVLFKGNEGIVKRVKGIIHTWMGVYLSELIKNRDIVHLHAHHGYLASWLAMVAAKMLGITYSFTLHGSDLLIDRVFLDKKIDDSLFCVTISDYNKHFMMERYPFVDPNKVIVNRMGVDCRIEVSAIHKSVVKDGTFIILTVGRLAPVKNHKFLIEGCAILKTMGIKFLCLIIGDGESKKYLNHCIIEHGLEQEVKILGHIKNESLQPFYNMADLFVLTSKSEGLPIVIMEAMLHGTPVLAPRITGIPEIVLDEQTGFLYESENLHSFVHKFMHIYEKHGSLEKIGIQARQCILNNYDRVNNMDQFANILIERISDHHNRKGDRFENNDCK